MALKRARIPFHDDDPAFLFRDFLQKHYSRLGTLIAHVLEDPVGTRTHGMCARGGTVPKTCGRGMGDAKHVRG